MIRYKLTVFLHLLLFFGLPSPLLFFFSHNGGMTELGLVELLALKASLWFLRNYELVEILVSKNGLLIYLPVSICYGWLIFR